MRVGWLPDYPTPASGRPNDMVDAIRLVFEDAVEHRVLDRPIELVERAVLGLPNGSFRSVLRAYEGLVEDDCVVIFGPYVSENVVPLARHVESRAEVPIITLAGSEQCLGEWVFALNNGHMEEEPLMLAAVMRHDGRQRIGVAYETSLIGQDYLRAFRDACAREGLDIAVEVGIPQVQQDKAGAMRALHAEKPDALLHVGFGHGLWGMNDALTEIGWDPPRYTTTAFELAYINDAWMQNLAGWVGLDAYDERNAVGQAFFDRFEQRYGRRPTYYAACLGRDVATVIVGGISAARPLTGEGVRRGLESVKMVPAATGAPGTKLRFGRYTHQGFMGTEYLVARYVLPDASAHVFHGTCEGTLGPVEARLR